MNLHVIEDVIAETDALSLVSWRAAALSGSRGDAALRRRLPTIHDRAMIAR